MVKGFRITPAQAVMLACVRDRGDPGWLYTSASAGKWERTWRTLQDRGFVEDRREIGPDGDTIIIPKGGPWAVTAAGLRALDHALIKP